MKYTLDIFKISDIPYSWNTIYVGKKLHILKPSAIADYAVEFLMQHPEIIDSNLAQLVLSINDKEINEAVEGFFKTLNLPKKDSPEWNLEKRKLRYCILEFLRKTSSKFNQFDKIKSVYEDFGYPEDMRKFIYIEGENIPKYEQLSTEEYDAMWEKELELFIKKEKEAVKNQSTDWPDSGIYYPLEEE